MRSKRRTRFWVEVAVTAVSATLLVVTLLWSDWIEVVFGFDPDGGDGSLEWLVAAMLMSSTFLFVLLARAEMRRAVVAFGRTS
jgi:hypothetical protein